MALGSSLFALKGEATIDENGISNGISAFQGDLGDE
jgi:hypothetical protein